MSIHISNVLQASIFLSYAPYTNAFGKGLEKFAKDIDQLYLDIHYPFKSSSARREDNTYLQLSMDIEMHTFQLHTEVRSLSEHWTSYQMYSRTVGWNL